MSFLYGLVDLLLTALITLDTLGLVGQLRNKKSTDSKDYTRVCFTWIFYLTLKSFTPNADEQFYRKLIRVVFLLAKVYVTLPILGGTMMIYNQAPKLISKGVDYAKSKVGAPPAVSNQSEPSSIPSSSMPSSSMPSRTTNEMGSELAEDESQDDKEK